MESGRPYESKQIKVIARQVSRKTGVDVEDLAQEGRLAAWEAEKTWNGTGSLASRCFVKARWAMYNYIQKTVWDPHRVGKAPKSVPLPDRDRISFSQWAAAIPRSDAIAFSVFTNDRKILAEEVIKAVGQTEMPEGYAATVLATTLGEMTNVTYAKSIGVDESNIRRILSAALPKVRKQLRIGKV